MNRGILQDIQISDAEFKNIIGNFYGLDAMHDNKPEQRFADVSTIIELLGEIHQKISSQNGGSPPGSPRSVPPTHDEEPMTPQKKKPINILYLQNLENIYLRDAVFSIILCILGDINIESPPNYNNYVKTSFDNMLYDISYNLPLETFIKSNKEVFEQMTKDQMSVNGTEILELLISDDYIENIKQNYIKSIKGGQHVIVGGVEKRKYGESDPEPREIIERVFTDRPRREAAAEAARQEAIEAARQEAIEAARQEAVEAARQAEAEEAARQAEAEEAARQAEAVEAARQEAVEAARQEAVEAARKAKKAADAAKKAAATEKAAATREATKAAAAAIAAEKEAAAEVERECINAVKKDEIGKNDKKKQDLLTEFNKNAQEINTDPYTECDDSNILLIKQDISGIFNKLTSTKMVVKIFNPILGNPNSLVDKNKYVLNPAMIRLIILAKINGGIFAPNKIQNAIEELDDAYNKLNQYENNDKWKEFQLAPYIKYINTVIPVMGINKSLEHEPIDTIQKSHDPSYCKFYQCIQNKQINLKEFFEIVQFTPNAKNTNDAYNLLVKTFNIYDTIEEKINNIKEKIMQLKCIKVGPKPTFASHYPTERTQVNNIVVFIANIIKKRLNVSASVASAASAAAASSSLLNKFSNQLLINQNAIFEEYKTRDNIKTTGHSFEDRIFGWYVDAANTSTVPIQSINKKPEPNPGWINKDITSFKLDTPQTHLRFFINNAVQGIPETQYTDRRFCPFGSMIDSALLIHGGCTYDDPNGFISTVGNKDNYRETGDLHVKFMSGLNYFELQATKNPNNNASTTYDVLIKCQFPNGSTVLSNYNPDIQQPSCLSASAIHEKLCTLIVNKIVQLTAAGGAISWNEFLKDNALCDAFSTETAKKSSLDFWQVLNGTLKWGGFSNQLNHQIGKYIIPYKPNGNAKRLTLATDMLSAILFMYILTILPADKRNNEAYGGYLSKSRGLIYPQQQVPGAGGTKRKKKTQKKKNQKKKTQKKKQKKKKTIKKPHKRMNTLRYKKNK